MRQIAIISTALLMTISIVFYARFSSNQVKSPQTSSVTVSLGRANIQNTSVQFSNNV